ncbi:MAG: indole-3-glycerol phosphate synthase TrpC [Planctomycetaceae bacterium]
MSDVLQKIVAKKRTEVDEQKATVPLAELESQLADALPVRGFVESLRQHHPMGLIAEVKRASPSAGLIREDFDPVEIAKTYEANGAACISVLTDEPFFQGKLEYLKAVRAQVSIPVLRKDFIIDKYQVVEARAAGADCILLIAECLDDHMLNSLFAKAHELGMQVLVELYDPENLPRVLALDPEFLGINNRNLRNFETRIEHTMELRKSIPSEKVLVAESGIHTREDVERLVENGVHAMLVGESLMRSEDIGEKVRELLGT